MKKNLFFSSILILAAFCSSTVALSGKPFEGVITYKITYPDSKFSESQLAMAPKVITVSIKGSKSRTDMQMSGMSTVTITDYLEKSDVTLTQIMGQKYAIKKTSAEMEKDMKSEGTPTVELSSETKVIAGYTCKKAVVTMNNDGVKSTFEAFYTSELGTKQANFNNPVFKDIDGVLLEFSMKTQMGGMKFTATSVDKKSVSAKDFEVPADYTPTTIDEMKSKFGGGNE